MNFDVVSMGSAVVDSFVNTDVQNHDNFLNYPVGAKMLITDLHFDVGGGGTNTAVAFARLGLKTGCISAVSDDSNGKMILDLLKKEHVSFLGCVKKNKAEKNKMMTGYSVILDSKDKDRTILTYKGVNNHIKINEVRVFNTKWLYFSSLLEESFKTQEKLAQRLAKKGVKLAFNPSSYHIKNMNLLRLLKNTYVLILNKEEAEMLCNKNKIKGEVLVGLTKLGPKIVVVTDKDNPARCYDGSRVYLIMPHKSIKVVERTGAGDAFASGFVAGVIAGLPIQKCLELGLREGEAVIQHFGAKNDLIRMKLK